MRTLSRVLLLVLGVLLGSAATSDAVVYEVSWVDVLFEPTYFHVDPRFLAGHPSGMVPVTVNGSRSFGIASHARWWRGSSPAARMRSILIAGR
jgi:hypothetical protein